MHWKVATNTYTICIKRDTWESFLSSTTAMETRLKRVTTLGQLIDLQILTIETMLDSIKSPNDCSTLIPMMISFSNSLRVACWEKKGEIIRNPSEFDNSDPAELYNNLREIARWMAERYMLANSNPELLFKIKEKVYKDLITLSTLIAYHPHFTIIILQPKET